MTTGHADVVGLWRAEMKHRKSERYIAQVEAIIARLVEHAGVPIEQVGRDHVSLWLSDLCDKTTARTANNNLAAVRGFARWGVRAEVMPRDPTEGVEPYRAVRREGRAFTVNEVVGLIRAAAEDEAQPRAECRHHDGSPVMRSALYRFLALTGMRAGEAQVLRWRDWEFEAAPPVVVLQPGLTRKGHAGRRVTLAPEDAAWFRAYAGRADMADLCFERPAWGVIQRDLRAAGIPQQDRYGRTAGLHAFRRYVGTALAQAGLSPKVAQARLGHSSITTTLRHYTDLGDGEEAASVLSLEGCHAEKSFAPLSVAGRMSYQPSMSFHPSNSGKTLDTMGEHADDLGMVMRAGQRRPPDPGENRIHRFESCIAHSCPQDSSPAQPNTDRMPSDGGNVWPRATSGDSLAAGGFLSAPDVWVETPSVGLALSPLSILGGGTTMSLPGFPVGMVSCEMPERGFAIFSPFETPTGSTLAPVDRATGLRGSVGADWFSAPHAGHVRDQQGAAGSQPADPFRPAVGQAAGRDSDCHLLSEGKTHPTRSCGLSRSQLVALLRASGDVREAVAALMEDDLWK